MDYSPDIAIDAYWDTHHILMVEVTELRRDSRGKVMITLDVVEKFSEGPCPERRCVLLSHLWFGTGVDVSPQPRIGDRLIIYYKKAGVSPIAVQILTSEPMESPAAKTLRGIAKLRAERGLDALSEAVFVNDAIIAMYCLRRMLNRSPVEVDKYIARLHQLRDNQDREVSVRLLANQLADKLSAIPDLSDEEYTWVKRALASSKQAEWPQLRQFTDRLLGFEKRRKESVEFLVQLVEDRQVPQAVRIAAYSAFADPRLFNFAKPDEESDQTFEACTRMLRDPDPMVRMAGAQLLHNICHEVRNRSTDRASLLRYVDRARDAIGKSVRVEIDHVVRARLTVNLVGIERK